MDKKEIWKCDGCPSNCIVFESYVGATEKPPTCLYDDADAGIEWKPTDKYKIVEVEEKQKYTPGPWTEENQKLLVERLKRGDLTIEIIDDKTPNCAICRWKTYGKNELISKDPTTYRSSGFCTSQGFLFCRDVYNSKECQKLFEPPEEPPA